MRGFLGAAAVTAAILLAHIIPGLIVSAIPEWLGNLIIVTIFGVLPIVAFVKVARWTSKAFKEEGNL